jgi:TonB family protein
MTQQRPKSLTPSRTSLKVIRRAIQLPLLLVVFHSEVARAQAFEPPVPTPRLANRSNREVLAALGTPIRLARPDEVAEACDGGKCDEVWIYGQTTLQECTLGGAVVVFYRGRVIRTTLLYRGCGHRAPDRFPLLSTSLKVPATAADLSPEEPIDVQDGQDFWVRHLQWTDSGVRYTALVVSPPKRSYESGRLVLRRATRQEFRLVSVSQLVVSAFTAPGPRYEDQVYEAIRKNWTVPLGLSLDNLGAEILVGVGPDGKLRSAKVQRSSGATLYDDSCLQAVRATKSFPPPPQELREKYSRGVVLTFGHPPAADTASHSAPEPQRLVLVHLDGSRENLTESEFLKKQSIKCGMPEWQPVLAAVETYCTGPQKTPPRFCGQCLKAFRTCRHRGFPLEKTAASTLDLTMTEPNHDDVVYLSLNAEGEPEGSDRAWIIFLRRGATPTITHVQDVVFRDGAQVDDESKDYPAHQAPGNDRQAIMMAADAATKEKAGDARDGLSAGRTHCRPKTIPWEYRLSESAQHLHTIRFAART